jgi:hypothetical protein
MDWIRQYILCREVCLLVSACVPPKFQIIVASVHIRHLNPSTCCMLGQTNAF